MLGGAHAGRNQNLLARLVVIQVIHFAVYRILHQQFASEGIEYINIPVLRTDDQPIVVRVVFHGAHRAGNGLRPNMVPLCVHADDRVGIGAQEGHIVFIVRHDAAVLQRGAKAHFGEDFRAARGIKIRTNGSDQREAKYNRQDQAWYIDIFSRLPCIFRHRAQLLALLKALRSKLPLLRSAVARRPFTQRARPSGRYPIADRASGD